MSKHSEVVAKAWKDPTFKKKLLSQPKEALKECGCTIPQNATVKVIEDAANSYTLVLPATPPNAQKMSEAELSKIAAGLSFFGLSGHDHLPGRPGEL